MSNTATGKTEIFLQIELTKFQTIGDKDETLKKVVCVCVYAGNCLPLRASPIPAVTKRIVGIFDVMAERENFIGSHCQKAEEDFFHILTIPTPHSSVLLLAFFVLLLTTLSLHSALHTDVSF